MNAVNTKLFVQAVTRFLAGLLIVGLLLFCLLAGMAADLYSFCPHVHCGTDFDEKKS